MLRSGFDRVYFGRVPRQCKVLNIWWRGMPNQKVILQGPTKQRKICSREQFFGLSATPHIPCRYPDRQVLLFSQW